MVWEYPEVAALKGRLYATSWHEGMDHWQKTAGVLWIYDPAADSWNKGPSIAPREFASVVADGERLYVAGGYGAEGVTDRLEGYDSASGTWQVKGRRFGKSMTTMPP